MERLTEVTIEDGVKLYDISKKLCLSKTTQREKIAAILKKLADYEDLEEELESIYGECPGLLKKVIDTLKSHPNIEETPVKSRLLTDEDADKWLEYKQLEEQGRLLKLPCKVGDILYEPTDRNTINEYRVKGFRVELYSLWIEWEIEKGFVYQYNYEVESSNIGKTVFLTKKEAEAKLKELGGIDSVE